MCDICQAFTCIANDYSVDHVIRTEAAASQKPERLGGRSRTLATELCRITPRHDDLLMIDMPEIQLSRLRDTRGTPAGRRRSVARRPKPAPEGATCAAISQPPFGTGCGHRSLASFSMDSWQSRGVPEPRISGFEPDRGLRRPPKGSPGRSEGPSRGRGGRRAPRGHRWTLWGMLSPPVYLPRWRGGRLGGLDGR